MSFANLTRLRRIDSYAAEDTGAAALFRLQTSAGTLDLAVDADNLRPLLQVLLHASVACAARRAPPVPLHVADAEHAVDLPASEVAVRPMNGAHGRLVVRTGVVDLSLAIGTREMAEALIADLRGA